MKRTLCLAVAIALALSMGGCGRSPVSEVSPATKNEQAVLSMLANKSVEPLLFHFKADKAFDRVDVWAETYKTGTLTSTVPFDSFALQPTGKRKEGSFAVTIDNTNDSIWGFSVVQGDVKLSKTSMRFLFYGSGLHATSQLDETTIVEDAKEIVLYVSAFAEAQEIEIYDPQRFVDEPELAERYNYLYLLKCRFVPESSEEMEPEAPSGTAS